MNLDTLNQAIAIIERTTEDKVCMLDWQGLPFGNLAVRSELEFHECGNTACFAGHVAISPEFLDTKIPGFTFYNTISGGPGVKVSQGDHLVARCGALAIGVWLDIPIAAANLLCHNIEIDADDYADYVFTHPVYGVQWRHVRKKHLLETLYRLRDVGVLEFLKTTQSVIDSADYDMDRGEYCDLTTAIICERTTSEFKELYS